MWTNEYRYRFGCDRHLFFCMRLFGTVTAALHAINLSRQAVSILRSVEASDDEKEAAARRLSAKLLVQLGSIAGRTLAALLVPTALLIVLDVPGLISFSSVVAVLDSWTVIILSLLLIPLLMVRIR